MRAEHQARTSLGLGGGFGAWWLRSFHHLHDSYVNAFLMPARVRSTEAEAKRWLGDAQAEEVARQAARDEKKAIKEARMQQRLKKKASNGAVHDINGTCMISWGGGGDKGEEDSDRRKQWPPASRCLKKKCPTACRCGVQSGDSRGWGAENSGLHSAPHLLNLVRPGSINSVLVLQTALTPT